MHEIEKGKVWRTMFSVIGCGYFVWEVREVVGDLSLIKATFDFYTENADGTLMSYQCYHFFSETHAADFLLDKNCYEELYVIMG